MALNFPHLGAFPYLGFHDYLPFKDILEHMKSVGYSNLKHVCSAINDYALPTRSEKEQQYQKFYGWHNNVNAGLDVTDKEYFPIRWFKELNYDPDKKYVAKVVWTKPGNFEPPHVDFYPSFLTQTKPDGTLYTEEETREIGKGIMRAWIPLENSKLGHIFYKEGFALNAWKQGDVFRIPNGIPHGFVNAGLDDRFLIVFTGHLL